MMPSLTVTYGGEDQTSARRIWIEQEPVADGTLTASDLEQMLAMVRAGISAKLYRPADCPASVVNGSVVVPLDVWVWPVPLTLEYSLAASMGAMGPSMAIRKEREFDVVVQFSSRVELPFVTDGLAWEWSDMGCYDHRSNRVANPEVMAEPAALLIGAEVLGVLRVKCAAVGFLHTVLLSIAKGTNSITDIEVAVTASWKTETATETETIDLDLPGCADLLLTTCDSDLLVEHRFGAVRDQEERVTVVYYSDCDGTELAVRHERP
jgi:hypothetical protein